MSFNSTPSTPPTTPPPDVPEVSVTALVVTMLVLGAVVLPFCILILHPFIGAFTRWRAHYSPLGIGLDGERIFIGPRLTSLKSTLQRTKRLEGWSGLYKGWIVDAIASFVFYIVMVIAVAPYSAPHKLPSKTVFVGFIVSLTFAQIPVEIIMTRVIVTPYHVPTSISGSLRILLTPYERRRPWVLFYPLIVPKLVMLVLGLGLLGAVSFLLIKRTSNGMIDFNEGEWRPLVVLGLSILSTIWTCPLSVATTKLCVQQNFGPDEKEEETALLEQEELPRCGNPEDVINLRTPEMAPYNGLIDTLVKIKNEEGTGALYRTWFWKALGQVASPK